MLATTFGLSGYLSFGDKIEGDILNNFIVSVLLLILLLVLCLVLCLALLLVLLLVLCLALFLALVLNICCTEDLKMLFVNTSRLPL